MKIAIIRVPTLIGPGASVGIICPPIGVAYLNAVCRKFTQNVTVVDAIGNFPEMRPLEMHGKVFQLLGQTNIEIAEAIPQDIELVLFSIMFSQDWPYVRELLRAVRLRCSDAKFIAGGEHITASAEWSMSQASEIDLCVLGEGEAVLGELLDYYLENYSLPSSFAGTVSRVESGGVQVNPRRSRIPSLDSIDAPNWQGLPLHHYFEGGHGFGVNLGRTMPILATRGCPYKCTFCSSPQMWTTRWSARTPESVVNEIRKYKSEYGATNFDFYDLTAIIRKDWIKRFCELLVAEKMDITWQLPSGTRSEAIDVEIAQLLLESGCRNLTYAPESGSGVVLERIKKNIRLPRMLESMRAASRIGLGVKANMLCGFPDEGHRDVWQTMWLIVRMAWIGIEDVSLVQFVPYPGSALFERLRNEGRVAFNDEYFQHLSYCSSLSKAQSYSQTISNRQLLFYKRLGPALFYFVSFCRFPRRVFKLMVHLAQGEEFNRLEKTLLNLIRGRKLFSRRKLSEFPSLKIPWSSPWPHQPRVDSIR